ncbi:MAG: oxygen-independent coproporphyrinogen III oxidase [Hyphomicrobiales bacterium]|nr:oxygen-independent coproporphyrinogen III oxidase [Hyphomicrobiales bacterium]
MRPELLQLLERRIPRYTSYPTAVQFTPAVDREAYGQWLATLPEDLPLSLYLHVPFCAELCLYCGCHTSVARRYSPVAAFVECLEREISLVAQSLGSRRRVIHIHWGGGTPTMLSARDFARLSATLRASFDIDAAGEIAIEIDPRTMTRDRAHALAEAGVTRASLGVQDFDDRVQKTVGRLQSFRQTAGCAEWLRQAGVASVNLDLMYGLPYQTAASVEATVRQALTLDPDRIALFGYAHVPWMKRHQRLLPEEALPSSTQRFEQCRVAGATLTGAGYQPIGLDHFAKPDDLLARRQREGRLHRNFQGYTTDEAVALIGFGPSAIGSLPQGYVQNAPGMVTYRHAIDGGGLATVRGCALTEEDRVRGKIIERLMCNLEIDLAAVAGARSVEEFAGELAALDPLVELGLVHRRDSRILVPEEARPFVRTVCAVFDAYLSGNETRYSRAM